MLDADSERDDDTSQPRLGSLEFVRGLPPKLPMTEIIDRAHKAGLSLSPKFVQYLQQKIAKMPKPKRPPVYKSKRFAFANFVRTQPFSLTADQVVKAAKAAGVKPPVTATQSIYGVRADMKKKGINPPAVAPAPSGKGPKLRVKKVSSVPPSGASVETVFVDRSNPSSPVKSETFTELVRGFNAPSGPGGDWTRVLRQAVLHVGIDGARRVLDEMESALLGLVQ